MEQKKCFQCYKSITLCICNHISKLPYQQKIIILQHPKEKFHPYNTAIIAKLSLANCVIIEGENFNHNKYLNERLINEDCILLFPSLYGEKKEEILSIENKTLIVIDASWRKAKKIYFLSINIQSLPKISLKPDQKSLYQIRKANDSNFLSTIEAIASVLNLNHDANTVSLLKPLRKMIELTNNFKGESNEDI